MTKQEKMDRRGFLKSAAAAGALLATPTLLAGCTTEQGATELSATGQGTPAEKLVVSELSQENRALATPDSSYMGGSVNYCGQEVVIGTGENGQIANQKMIDHHKQFQPPHLDKVSDRIYVAVGNNLSNSTMIIGDTGIIIVDTGDCIETAQWDLDLFRTVTDKPVKAVIYSHSHYCNGTKAFIPEGNPDNIPVIAQERLTEASMHFLNEKQFYTDRAWYMFGSLLSMEGEDGSVGSGTGAFLLNPNVQKPTSGHIAPNTYIPFDEHMVEMEIDGLHFKFFPTVADDVGNINMYIEEENTVIANQIWGVFWNMYTLRGDSYRDPMNSIACVDDLIALNPDNLISVHGAPVIGHENTMREMTVYRDGVQYIYDQTIRCMNNGLNSDHCVANVRIPEALCSDQMNKFVYGEAEHYVRSVYGGLVGWFERDPIELHPVSKEFEYGQLVEALGGSEAVIAAANAALEDNQFAWAGTLANYVLTNDPENTEAKAAKAQALRKMAQVSEATNTRHWYMTEALVLEGTIDPNKMPQWATRDKLTPAPRALFLNKLRVSFDPAKLEGIDATFMLTYKDEDVSNAIHVRNYIGCVTEGAVSNPDVELRINYQDMLSVILGETTLEESIASGAAEVVGDKTILDSILAASEMKL